MVTGDSNIVRYDGMSEEQNTLGVNKDSQMVGDVSTENSKSLDIENEVRGCCVNRLHIWSRESV